MNEHRQLLDQVGHIGVLGEYIGISLLGSVLIVGVFVSFAVIQRRRRQHRQIALARQRARSSSASSRNEATYPMEQRRAHIEAYLVTKPVVPHDILCDCARGVAGAKETSSNLLQLSTERNATTGSTTILFNYFVKSSTEPFSEKTGEDGSCHIDSNQNEACTICFESFQPFELVSWSPNPSCCKRVFHHSCYKEWLLMNKHCPWCRETVLPVDGYSTVKTTKKQIHDLLIAQQQRAMPSFYCCTHGKVEPIRAFASSRQERSFDLIAERSTYLCSRDEIQRSFVKCLFEHEDKESSQAEASVVMSGGDQPETHIDSHEDLDLLETGSNQHGSEINSSSRPVDKDEHAEEGDELGNPEPKDGHVE